MLCRQCGTEIAEKALICYRCGTATTEARFKPAAINGRRSPLRIVLIVALVLTLLVIAAFFLIHSHLRSPESRASFGAAGSTFASRTTERRGPICELCDAIAP